MPTNKTDAALQQDVRQELEWYSPLEARAIRVAVDRGIVTLTGTVTSYAEKLAMRDVARRVAGVRDVVNAIELAVPSGQRRTDTELGEAVRQALTWDVFVPAARIESTLSDGWVTLAGEVDRWAERTEAERAVRRLQGVRGVTNSITVRGPRVAPEIIRETIEQALERRIEQEAREIAIRVEDGVVTLSGFVSSWPEEEAIVEAVSHAPGVRSVNNELRSIQL